MSGPARCAAHIVDAARGPGKKGTDFARPGSPIRRLTQGSSAKISANLLKNGISGPAVRSTMKRVLIVKVTSLGDIVEALPVVADVQRAFPGVKVDWAADEAFADIVRWNAGVDRVLCAPLRRFKKARRWSDFKAIWASISELRAYRYDYIIDIHGVYKSAIIAFLARSSRRIGYQSQDLGERGA